ncbi:GrpB family protein [Planomicrobium okeanokoites]|uniref:GrpB family protein n=1 Tax=Planomicrobium okeanokoites TaxID=244 RepID=UPI002491BDAF|nr:GrpB family protein [Planomicrobium okeanokoites]
MKLGLKMNEVKIVDYTPEWAAEFIRVQEELVENTGLDENRIEHIGSTAIKGMAAKPILDLIVGVDDLNQADRELLQAFQQTGFLRLKVERPGEIVLAKFTDDTYQEKTHFIHLVEYRGDLWNDLIYFRDYLNSNVEAKTQYLQVKLAYLEKAAAGMKEYTDHKEAFVKGIIAKRTESF